MSHYGFRVLDQISLFDEICCDTLNAVHRCRIKTREGMTLINRMAEEVRKALSAGATYHFTGVTRKDLKQKNQMAHSAINCIPSKHMRQN